MFKNVKKMLTAKQCEDRCQEALAQPHHRERQPFVDLGSAAASQEPHSGSAQGGQWEQAARW